MNLPLILLLAYSLVLIALGLWIGRRVRGSSDFFVAGRRLNPLLLFSTVLAANIGAGSTVGATGLAYRDGLSAWWWNGSAGLGSLVLAFWIGPRIWREAAKHNHLTVGDYLERRYGRAVRAWIAVLLWAGTLSILAGQILGIATILDAVAGVPRWVGCLAGGLVMTTYFAAGGLLSSAWVNLVQLGVLLGGFAVIAPLTLIQAGGWQGLATAPGLPPGFLDFWRVSAPGAGWTLVAVLVPAFIISPGLLQKAYGASSERTIRLGIGANAIILLLFAFVPVVLGMLARLNYPDLPARELALPTILVRGLPPAAGALALAAIFSAEVSTCDAILFMLATSLSQDLYRGVLRPQASDAQVLSVARWAAIAGGAAGVLVAMVAETIIQQLTIFYSLLTVSLFVPIVAGLYSRKAGTAEAAASIAAGVLVMLVMSLVATEPALGMLTPQNAGMLAAVIAYAAVRIARKNYFRNSASGRVAPGAAAPPG